MSVTDKGFVANEDTCVGDVTITVDSGATPQVSGFAGCTMSGSLTGQTVELTFTGSLASETEVVGTHETLFLWADESNPWSALFFDEETLSSTFAGEIYDGPNGVTWSGSFSATKQ